MTTSCTYPALEGIEVFTQTEKVLRARRMIIELILAMCPGDKLIQDMAREMGVTGPDLSRRTRTASFAVFAAGVCERSRGGQCHPVAFAEIGER